jgi:acyl-coenzyme A synthetase/AMP-(fatty) acid ligase
MQPFLPSTRNSDEANEHLFRATMCNKCVYSPEKVRKVQDFKKFQPELELFEIPSLWEMLATESPLYPYVESFEHAEDTIAMIIHSSGTTGRFDPTQVFDLILACLTAKMFPRLTETRFFD